MKSLFIGFVILGSVSVIAQTQRQQPSRCPEGTVPGSYTIIARDWHGNVISTNFGNYCRPILAQRPNHCPEGTVEDIYTIIATDEYGNVISTDFQSYCRK